ncbi:hypothetical protein GCM10025780_30390 [Frondihabitans cladoniiphilus]|uniref:Uncharacterized protein n=1 Tax=Frondihabitans cladoniiphilus TaxID=715785 RepID=A0ABP8W7C8_9MICO
MQMSKKTPEPFPYLSFASIGASPVHLRLKGEDATDEPTYKDAELISEPAPTGPHGELSARFKMPVPPYEVTVSEVQYVAWNRYQ